MWGSGSILTGLVVSLASGSWDVGLSSGEPFLIIGLGCIGFRITF